MAMALGVADHPWSIAESIDASEAADDEGKPFSPLRPVPPPAPLPAPVPERPPFTVIQGGRRECAASIVLPLRMSGVLLDRAVVVGHFRQSHWGWCCSPPVRVA
jgi:hypothetical protein